MRCGVVNRTEPHHSVRKNHTVKSLDIFHQIIDDIFHQIIDEIMVCLFVRDRIDDVIVFFRLL